MNLNQFKTKTYDSANYNCAHFLCDAWLEITNQDISFALFDLCKAREQREVKSDKLKRFKRLDKPESPCILLFSGKTETHTGIFLDNLVLHFTENGMQYVPLSIAMIGFDSVRYYTYD